MTAAFVLLFKFFCSFKKFFLGLNTHKAFYLNAVFKINNGGNGHYAKFHCNLSALINVDFSNGDFAFKVLSNLINNRSNHFAGAAPGCPKINNNRAVCNGSAKFLGRKM